MEGGTHHSFWVKYGIYIGLILATILNGVLLYGIEINWTASGKTYRTVTRNRGSVQILVQILSHLLGLLSVVSVTQLINFRTRIRALQTTMTLDMIAAWASLSSARIDWSLPARFLFPTLLFVALTAGPAALWTGALTPIVTTAMVNSTSLTIAVPAFSTDRYNSTLFWNRYQSLTNNESAPPIRNSKGVFGYAIAKNMLGPLLFSGSTASIDNATWTHQKLDDTRYSYMGRSYGAGASVGLVDDFMTDLIQGYMFQQQGYLPLVTCIKNQSGLYWLEPRSQQSTIKIVVATGELPNSQRGQGEASEYATIGDGQGVVAFGLATQETRDKSKHILAMAAGAQYGEFNATQCTITFAPRLFNVSVNTIEKLIKVVPMLNDSDIDIEPSGSLQYLITRNVGDVSIVGTGLYTSLLGDSLRASNSTYWAGASSTAQAGSTREGFVLKGSENLLTSLLDDVIVAFGSAQLMVASDSVNMPVSLWVAAIQFGTKGYTQALLAINCVILVLALVEMVKTRLWEKLPFFDYTNVRHNIIASSAGGSNLANAASLMDGKAASMVNVDYTLEEHPGKRSVGMLALAQKYESTANLMEEDVEENVTPPVESPMS